MILEIHSEAKCKHCKHLKRESAYKKDGSLSKKCHILCEMGKVIFKGERSKICDNFKPYWEETK